MSYNTSNPFNWDVNEEGVFKGTAELRNATYNDPAEEEFTGNGLESFIGNDEAPTPQIKRVCGIECPE